MFRVEATCPSQERMSAQGPSAAIRNVSPEGLESRGDPVIRSIAREQMPSSLEMACFGGSNRCAHRWKQRQTSPEKPVGTSVGIGAPGSAENTRKMAFGEIVSPVGPTSSFVAAAQRRGSCQTHHRACSKSSSWKSACQAGSTNFVLTVQRRLPRPLSRDRPAEVVCTSHLCRPADFGRILAGWAKDYERQFIAHVQTFDCRADML